MNNNYNYKVQRIVSKLLSLWIISISILIIFLSKYADDEQKKIYRFGPNNELNILGFIINTREKYILVISYCFINSIFRTLYNSVLHSWLINNIQDESREKNKDIKNIAYEITLVTTIYNWFDWFIYINILLSQIDMVIIEIIADLLISLFTTRYYLNKKNKYLDDKNIESILLNLH